MSQEERERRAAYARVRASFALEGMQLTRAEEAALEPYFREEISLKELTALEITRCGDLSPAKSAGLIKEIQCREIARCDRHAVRSCVRIY